MFTSLDYTIIIVSDMQRSVEFYRDKLGIPLKFQTPDWTEFITGTTTLALHIGGPAREFQDTGDQSKTAGTCSVGFNVADVDKRVEVQRNTFRNASNSASWGRNQVSSRC